MTHTQRQAWPESLHDDLKRLHLHLQIVHAGVVVAASALHYQNAERDEEIARVLERCVGERLYSQIERTAGMIASLSAARRSTTAAAWNLETSSKDGHEGPTTP